MKEGEITDITLFKFVCRDEDEARAREVLRAVDNVYVGPITFDARNHVSKDEQGIYHNVPGVELRGICRRGNEPEAEVVGQLVQEGICEMPLRKVVFIAPQTIKNQG